MGVHVARLSVLVGMNDRGVDLHGKLADGFVGDFALRCRVRADKALTVHVAQETHLGEVHRAAQLRLAALTGQEPVRLLRQPSRVPHLAVLHPFGRQQHVALVVFALHRNVHLEAVYLKDEPRLERHQSDVLRASRSGEPQTALHMSPALPLSLDGSERALHPWDVHVVTVHQSEFLSDAQ